jgi:hypothetical protein
MKVAELFDPHAIHNLADPKEKEITKVSKVEDLAAILKAQCSDIIAAYQKAGDPIYRGIKGATDQVVITQIRQERLSLEMNPDWHEQLHKSFIKVGLKATRKNAIFCTTSTSIASDWGTPYVIFPKNGWAVTVFKEFKDSYTFYKLSNLRWKHDVDFDEMSDDEVQKVIVDELKTMDPWSLTSSNDLATVIKEQYEDILLTGSSYIAVRSHGVMMEKLKKLLDLKI